MKGVSMVASVNLSINFLSYPENTDLKAGYYLHSMHVVFWTGDAILVISRREQCYLMI
jgi:hypothetical protein